MKKSLVLLMLISLSSIPNIYSQNLESSKKLGLIAYLTFIKANSQKILLNNCEENEVKICYLELKTGTDLFINQFCADMIDINGLSLYRNMNTYLESGKTENNRIKKYKNVLDSIEYNYGSLNNEPCRPKIPDEGQLFNGAEEVLSLLGLEPYSLFKDIKAKKDKKITTLTGYIKELSLKPLTEPKKQ